MIPQVSLSSTELEGSLLEDGGTLDEGGIEVEGTTEEEGMTEEDSEEGTEDVSPQATRNNAVIVDKVRICFLFMLVLLCMNDLDF
jgi:hypothetical protein